VLSIAVVLYAVSGFFLPAAGRDVARTPDLAMALAAGTLTAVLSTLAFAVAESQLPSADPT